MRHRPYIVALLAGVGLIVCAGLVLAQAPDWAAGPQGRPERQWQRGPGLFMLLFREDVTCEVTNTDKGVDLKVTSQKPDGVAALQEDVQTVVMNLQGLADQPREPGAEGGRGRPGRDIMALLAAGDAEISCKKVENGVVVSFTSDKPEVVQRLQQEMPQRVADAREQAQQFRQGFERWQRAREALAVLANEQVKVEVEETAKGISVTVTSENPETVKQIKEKLTAYYQEQQELARNMLRWGARMGGPGGPAGAGPWMRGAGERMGRRRAGQPEGAPPAGGQ